MGINNKAKVEKKSSRGRAKQLADAQVVYRRKMRDEGYQRLKEISERLGVSRRDVLERLVSEARNGYIELARDAS
jgi:Mn-dependent DtxR family transcriptional regulator